MSIIIFIFLPVFVLSFYQIDLEPVTNFEAEATFFLRPNENEYIIIYPDSRYVLYSYYSSHYTNLIRVDSKTDEIISHDRLYNRGIIFFKSLGSNINITTFEFVSTIQNNGKDISLSIGDYPYTLYTIYLDQVYSSNSILIGCYRYVSHGYFWFYEFKLHLIKEPYNIIDKTLDIKNFPEGNTFKLIGLKNFFIFAEINEIYNGLSYTANYTYKILDSNNLNVVNSLTVKYSNYTKIIISPLLENKVINEFMICIKYYESSIECQIVKFEYLNLLIVNTYTIFTKSFNTKKGKDFLDINLFDGDKIGCYYGNYYENYHYITILQYNKNGQLFYYKNIKDIPFVNNNYIGNLKIIMTNKGIGLLQRHYLIYIHSICVSKNISLYPDLLLEFPIKDLIIPGIDSLKFSFVFIHEGLTIYKNSTELKIGEIYNDLNNFTYFLKLDTFFDDIFSIKIKNHEFDYICDINIDIISQTNISTYKESHKCLKNKDYEKINNIKYSNLFDYFTVNSTEDVLQFEFILENEPKENELKFYFGNKRELNCIKNGTQIICKISPSYFPRLERIHIFSYLSCYNLIDVGWFEISDMNISNVYSLISYNFDDIANIYEPTKKIIEYNPAMINYYYWFSCLSYCDNKNIKEKNCCNNILNKWEIVFYKEYSYDGNINDVIFGTLYEINNKIKVKDVNIDIDELMPHLIKDSSKIGQIVKSAKGIIDNNPYLTSLIGYMFQVVYQYHFIILKNDEYKKIVVAFPGITYYFQIIEEFIQENMVELGLKSEKKLYYVMENYKKIFDKIETDLFDNLALLPGINNKDYQVIFIGHSLGGAVATISSFYYIKKYNFTAENILISFGQPKVGSEVFAKELTKNLKQIYRIARKDDIAILFPLKGIDFFIKWFKTSKMLMNFAKFLISLITGNIVNKINSLISAANFIVNIKNFTEEYSYLVQDRSFEDMFYSHIGGLYMIDDETNRVYHCTDFFNKKRDHFICKNPKFKLSLSLYSDFMHNRNYLTKNQNMLNSCQHKKLKFFKISVAESDKLLRRLETVNNYYYNIKKIRILIDIQNIQQELILFKEINFERRKFEFCYIYKSEEILKVENLFLIINPKNKQFFGEICFSQNIDWLSNKDYDLNNCYFVNTKNIFAFNIELKNKIIDEKNLYIYIKGKVSGTLELYDLTKNKILNISSSYYIPYIENFPLNQSINLILPKIDENIYMNIIINDYGLTENKNISSIFEIYKNENKVYYENNYLIMEKDYEYYFKYYPNKYELILNFINIYSNVFLEKQFYIINAQNIYINYNIESKSNNRSFGLLFEFNGVINIKGYFSNNLENQDNINDYALNNNKEKYFYIEKNSQFNYLNLNINIESELGTELIIYEFQDVIIINKMNSIFELNKTRNYLFLLDESFQINFAKFESYICISINNDKNILKLILSEGDFITSKNFLITRLNDIKGIFVKINENDIFMIKIIPEETSKYLEEKGSLFSGNTFMDEKKYSIDFIHNDEEIYTFYNPISSNLNIYEIKYGSYFKLEEIIEHKINYTLLFGLNNLEEQKTHFILKESSSPFLYENYINNLMIDLYHVLDASKISFLFMDFEYTFAFNKKIKKILLKVLNNANLNSLSIKCENEIIEIKENIQIINVEKCNSTFIISGNNSLIYFYLPLILADSYTVIENEDNFELTNINQFFFVPKRNDFNTINILLTLENINNYAIYLTYYIDYGIIPFSRNIDKKIILIKNETNIIIPNYSNHSKDDEKFFIFFKFNTSISKLKSKIVYENILYLDDQTYLILKPGIHTIKFKRDIDYYLNITKFNNNKNNSFYSIYKNEKFIKKNMISNSKNIIQIDEPSYNENIKLKIETDDELLLHVSSEYFQEFSFISYNRNINIKQEKNILNIQFNTTKYNSKLEYNIALIDEDDNIKPINIHKKFYENKLIYKNIIYSTGIEPIETNFTLNDFNYNKKYTVIAYGKEIIRDSFNYFYLEPKTLLIIDPNQKNLDTYDNIEDSDITHISDIIDMPDNTDNTDISDIVEFSDNINISQPEEKQKNKLSGLVIFIIVLGCIVIIGGLIIGLIFYYRKKRKNIIESENQKINNN